MKPIVVIEDSTIARMVQDEKFTSALPCLSGQKDAIMPASTGCGSCAKARADKQRAALRAIKTCLSGMSQENRIKLKELLDAAQVKVVSVSATGQTLTTTF
jgi:hypothetical protein